ncbi:hypothetical protein DFH28DRAFT_1117905 [Melampsora americana]|nr:hypothetical protein DFH28DRAFT_1117905 [Melampsora americana]
MTLDLLRLLADEFKRDSVGDAIMTLRGTSCSVNVYGTLAYRIQDAGTVDATAQVTTLEYNSETQGTTDTGILVFMRDNAIGLSRGEQIRFAVVDEYTVSIASIAGTLERFSLLLSFQSDNAEIADNAELDGKRSLPSTNE